MNDLQKATIQAIVNIFETGKVSGNYSAVTVIPGDSGHLSYGRSQVSLGSGNLYLLLQKYCARDNAEFGARLSPYLPRFEAKDVTLDTDQDVRSLLKSAGADPVMRAVQDSYFDENYFTPAIKSAQSLGLTNILSQGLAYDGCIQGGWYRLIKTMPKVSDVGEEAWAAQYVTARRDWLLSCAPPLPITVYRMDSFQQLMDSNNWDLALPITVHGVTITEELLSGAPRELTLTSPFMRGDDVATVQSKLGIGPADGVYGANTARIVAQFQLDNGITGETGVGPLTRAKLGL